MEKFLFIWIHANKVRAKLEKVLGEVQGEESRKTIGKRRLLALATLTAVGLSIKPLIEKAHADSGEPLIIGQKNSGDDTEGFGHTTELTSKVDSGSDAIYSVLHVQNTGIQCGNSPPFAISGYCAEGIGVAGYSEKGTAVHGNGVWNPDMGGTVNCVGVGGHSNYGIGVQASSPNGIALKVEGKSNFNGRGYLSAKVNDIPNGTGMSAALLVENLAGAIEGNVPPQAIAGMVLQGRGVEGQSVSGEGVIGIAQETGTGVKARHGRMVSGSMQQVSLEQR